MIKELAENLFLVVRMPKKLFASLAGGPDVMGALLIITIMGILYGLQGVLHPDTVQVWGSIDNLGSISILLYAVLVAITSTVRAIIGLSLLALWIKVWLRFLHVELKYANIFSIVPYALVPNLIFLNVIKLLWPDIVMGTQKDAITQPSFYKTSFAHLFSGLEQSHERLYYLLGNIELFGLWSFVLLVISIAIAGKITYQKSFLIVFAPWLLIIALILSSM